MSTAIGRTRNCGPSVDCRPDVSPCRFLAERILVKPDWPLLPWSGLLIAVKAFARVRDIPAHQRQRTSV